MLFFSPTQAAPEVSVTCKSKTIDLQYYEPSIPESPSPETSAWSREDDVDLKQCIMRSHVGLKRMYLEELRLLFLS